MNERDFEEIVCKYPDLIEEGIVFEGRQVNLKGKRADIIFRDKSGQRLIVEMKKGIVLREHIAQLLDYEGYFLSTDDPTIRVMLIGNRIPENLKRSLDHHGLEWRELTISFLADFLKTRNDPLSQTVLSDVPLVVHKREKKEDTSEVIHIRNMTSSDPKQNINSHSVIIFDGNDREYQKWVESHLGGYVLNTTRGINAKYLVVHRASCRRVRDYNDMAKPGGYTERRYIKICSENIKALNKWAEKHGGPQGKGFTLKCSFCI